MRLRRLFVLVVLSGGVPVARPRPRAGTSSRLHQARRPHQKLTRQKEYKQALADLPADVDEYGDCRNVIRTLSSVRRAQRAPRRQGAAVGNRRARAAAPSDPPATGPSPRVTSRAAPRRDRSKSRPPAANERTAVDPGNDQTGRPGDADKDAALIDATRNGGGPSRSGRTRSSRARRDSNFTEGLPPLC